MEWRRWAVLSKRNSMSLAFCLVRSRLVSMFVRATARAAILDGQSEARKEEKSRRHAVSPYRTFKQAINSIWCLFYSLHVQLVVVVVVDDIVVYFFVYLDINFILSAVMCVCLNTWPSNQANRKCHCLDSNFLVGVELILHFPRSIVSVCVLMKWWNRENHCLSDSK